MIGVCMYYNMPKGSYQAKVKSNSENIKPLVIADMVLYHLAS